MIIEDNEIKGLQAELAEWDQSSEKLGFVRWQWEYHRATYDLKLEDKLSRDEFFLRINARSVEGKLEDPAAVLVAENVYLGKTSFPHGLDYEAQVPESVIKAAQQKLSALKQLLVS